MQAGGAGIVGGELGSAEIRMGWMRKRKTSSFGILFARLRMEKNVLLSCLKTLL